MAPEDGMWAKCRSILSQHKDPFLIGRCPENQKASST